MSDTASEPGFFESLGISRAMGLLIVFLVLAHIVFVAVLCRITQKKAQKWKAKKKQQRAEQKAEHVD
jgi:large-conductance mechanosensitive channel